MHNFIKICTGLVAGIIFGAGLTLSEMTHPAVVIGFLDLSGQWDPRLLVVMVSALIITAVGFYLIFKRAAPLLEERFSLPTLKSVDKNLLIGASCFGIGWGLSGYCPGPVIAGLFINPHEALPFIIAMLAGMKIAHWQKSR